MITLDREHLSQILRPRPADSHKGTYGTLQCVVGSERYRGAAVLAAMGALRSGAGIVRVCSVEKVCAAVAASYPSATLLPLSASKEGMISSTEAEALMASSEGARALLIGCGLGQSEDTADILYSLLSAFGGCKILDADALNLIASRISHEEELSGDERALSAPPARLSSKNPLSDTPLSGTEKYLFPERRPDIRSLLAPLNTPTTVITPHVGELSRLLGYSVDRIKSDLVGAAECASEKFGCITVLKDCRTVISVPDSETRGYRLYISELGKPGLAKGGSGDVLAGLIAGFITQGYSAEEGAVLGVLVHGMAAELCARELSEYAMLPSDLGKYICRVLSAVSIDKHSK